VVAAATYHSKDLQTFWKSFGITRALPKRKQMMEPVITRITETILDTQWASSTAPGAEIITYEGPDARNTPLLFSFNEAIALNEVQVLTDSFAHREDSEPLPLRHQYNHAALMGAALGITVISASGDSARPDIPCTSPYVVCVGGTDLVTNGNGTVISEVAWDQSGSGDAKTFLTPQWQVGIVPNDRRATVDVALNAGFAGGGLLDPPLRQLGELRRDLVLGAGVRGADRDGEQLPRGPGAAAGRAADADPVHGRAGEGELPRRHEGVDRPARGQEGLGLSDRLGRAAGQEAGRRAAVSRRVNTVRRGA
jgi:hypothetical protein